MQEVGVKEPEKGNLRSVVMLESPWWSAREAQVEAEVRETVGVGERKEAEEQGGEAGAGEILGVKGVVQNTKNEISKRGSRTWMISKCSTYMMEEGEVE